MHGDRPADQCERKREGGFACVVCVKYVCVMCKTLLLPQTKAAAEGQSENIRFFENLSHRLFHLGGVTEQYDAEGSVDP